MDDKKKAEIRQNITQLVEEGIAPLVNRCITQRLVQYAEYLHEELVPYPVTGVAEQHVDTLMALRHDTGEVFITEIDAAALDFAIEAINARERALTLRPIGESPRTIADEMEAWSEKKMSANGSSRIDRTLVREWAKRLRGEA